MEIKRIAFLNDPIEADILRQVLRDNGIANVIESNFDGAYGNLFQMAEGWGQVLADPADEERILAFLAEIRSQNQL